MGDKSDRAAEPDRAEIRLEADPSIAVPGSAVEIYDLLRRRIQAQGKPSHHLLIGANPPETAALRHRFDRLDLEVFDDTEGRRGDRGEQKRQVKPGNFFHAGSITRSAGSIKVKSKSPRAPDIA